MSWESYFEEGHKLVLSTSSKSGRPNANVVICVGFVDGKILVANCQMTTTIKNLKENNHVCIISEYIRALGVAQIYTEGKYFDLCVEKNTKYTVKHAILIEVQEVFDLDKCEKISLKD